MEAVAVSAIARPSADERIRAALWFVDHGFRVFPVWSATDAGVCRCPEGAACSSPGKHPITTSGFKDATDDQSRIRTFLAAKSEPNYGLVNPEGVFALDVDGPGVATLTELEAEHGPLPPTLRTQTAHGEHIFLRWPDALPRPIGHLFGYVTRWASGRDAGYVIGPRSVHPSGFVYAPAPGSAFEIADVPATWAHAALGPVSPVITITGGLYHLPDRVTAAEGRYDAIRQYTAHLYNRGLAIEEMWPLVRDMLAPRFDVALTDGEVRARFDRVTKDLPQRLGPPRAAPPEPVDPSSFPIPEDRGQAVLSDLGEVEYVEDLLRPGRIVVWAAEEGSGKSFTVSGELAIRVATAGGSFVGTWPVLETGRVLVLSEMHGDDDFAREAMVLGALGLERDALAGRYYRLSLMTAAGGRPVLMVPEWRGWATQWMDANEVKLLVVDTATGATQVEPWGKEIQGVYAGLRMMLEAYPRLVVVLVVHVRKPSGPGDRRLSDVMGEWGRWCDVVVLQENDGQSLERAKITVRKRVRHERRITATKRGGLLVEPTEAEGGSGPKVQPGAVVAAVTDHPGLSYKELGLVLGVSADTAKNYVKSLPGQLLAVPVGPRRTNRVYLTSEPPNTLEQAPFGGRSEVATGETAPDLRTPEPTYIGSGVSSEVGDAPVDLVPDNADPPTWLRPCRDYPAHQSSHRRTDAGWVCDVCDQVES